MAEGFEIIPPSGNAVTSLSDGGGEGFEIIPADEFNAVEAFILGGGSGASLGTIDEIKAGINSGIRGMGTFESERQRLQGRLDRAHEEHPTAFTAGEVVGGLSAASICIGAG